MRVILFEPRFAPLVASGKKRQTIRRTARCEPGDRLSLRRWSGKPYRSGHVVLAEAVCTEVLPVVIGHGPWESGLRVGDEDLSIHDAAAADQERLVERRLAFAQADGFLCFPDLVEFFRNRKPRGKKDVGGLPFEGVVIRWEPTTST